MLRYALKRGLMAVLVAITVSVATFFLLDSAGDPAEAIAGPDAPRETIEQIRKQYGFDRPWPVRYAEWAAGVARGDLGQSFLRRQPVAELIASHAPVTIKLAFSALLVTILDRRAARRGGRAQAQQRRRPPRAVGGRGGAGAAELLARPRADRAVRGDVPDLPGVGRRHLAPLRAAGAGTGHDLGAGGHAVDAHRAARRDGFRLHPHRAREGLHGRAARSCATPCATRCCRWSACSRCSSATSSAAR